jgi:hypothetical protein
MDFLKLNDLLSIKLINTTINKINEENWLSGGNKLDVNNGLL